MVAHKWGTQTPNGDFNPVDVVDVFGDGFYIIMQDQFNRLPELRNLASKAFIMARFYLPNWYITNPTQWVQQIKQILLQVNQSDSQKRRNVDMLDAFTWANEQNLKDESGGSIGSSLGEMIKPGEYQIIRDWNLSVLTTMDAMSDFPSLKRVFPALAMGNSDDQDDGGGVGLQILQPVIDRCDYGAIHPYWSATLPLNDEWRGLGRLKKQLPFFPKVPVLVTETGNFAVMRPDAPDQYVAAGYIFQGIEQIQGFAYFIFADPTKHHQLNDMSRNTAIFDAIKKATKTPRPTEWTPTLPATPVPTPTPPLPTPLPPEPTPAPNLPPQTTPGKLLVGYQVWQWDQVPTVANYTHLKRDMEQIGAVILADKYADSTALQGTFDPDPMAIKSIQVMKDRRKWCEDNGYLYIPWDVPRAIPVNNDPVVGARQEALFHANVCNQVGLTYRISDLEFYSQFFGYDLQGNSFFTNNQQRNDAAELYYRIFKENSDTKTILQPDLRQWNVIQFSRLVPYLYAVVGQSYAYSFQLGGDQRSHEEIVADFINKSKALELPAFGLSLYSNKGANDDTPVNLATSLCQQAIEAGAKYLLVYKAPVSTSLHGLLKSVAGTNLGDNNMEDIEILKSQVWADAEALRRDYAIHFGELANRARGLGYGWMGNGLDAAKLAVEAAELAAKTAIKAPKE